MIFARIRLAIMGIIWHREQKRFFCDQEKVSGSAMRVAPRLSDEYIDYASQVRVSVDLRIV